MTSIPAAAVAERPPVYALELVLRPSLYIPELRSKRKGAALEEMVQALAKEGVTRHPDAILDVLKRREALGSTGLGRGIAIPHGRSTLVSERAVVVARSTRGIDFDAADGVPVHLCFLVVGPPMEQDTLYLRLLAEIVGAVRLKRTRDRLLDAPDFAAVRRLLLGAG